MKPSLFVLVLAALLGGAALIATPGARLTAVAATPPPSPPPIDNTPVATPEPYTPSMPDVSMPTPSATFAPPAGASKPTPSPRPNARKGLDGVWEVQIQHPTGTDYTHFKLQQQGDALTGTYLDSKNKSYPLAGSLEGSDVRLIVTMPDGTTLLLEGKLDGTTDMIGMLTTPNGQVPFTAAYRAKEKWIENVNPSPGGIPSQGGYTPP